MKLCLSQALAIGLFSLLPSLSPVSADACAQETETTGTKSGPTGTISATSAAPSASSTRTGALEVIQAHVPPRSNYNNPSCSQTLFNHVFGNSDGVPYVGTYSPPKNCEFTTTIFSISVTISGSQYDRLALLFFGDTEIWRTSTAMPGGYDIYWDYQKDMTIFDTLMRSEQKIIFDLSNVVDGVLYTGSLNVTMKALYFNDDYADLDPAEVIYPISLLASSQNISSVMSLPDDNGTVPLVFPKNVKTAVVSILASGNGAEEFWYTNVPSEFVNTFPSNPGWLFGYSPFREIDLLIDGNLAGVSWPFPSLFTGGVDPGLWRPIAGIDAYDLSTFEIDITSWLPLLCDGESHTIGFKMVGFDSSIEGNMGTVGENWYVTGSVFLWLDKNGKQTTGSAIERSVADPTFEYLPQLNTTTVDGIITNSSFAFTLAAKRSISVSSTIHLSSGSKTVSWKQDLSFKNIQNMDSLAFNQSLAMTSSGIYSNSFSTIPTDYYYPLNLFSAYIIAPSVATLSSVYCLIDRSQVISGMDTLPYLTGTSAGAQSLATRQNAESMYFWNETIVLGTDMDTSTAEQWFSYTGSPGNIKDGVKEFSKTLKASNDLIVLDKEAWTTIEVPPTVPLPLVEGEPVV